MVAGVIYTFVFPGSPSSNTTVAIQPPATLPEKSQCASDGAAYVQKYEISTDEESTPSDKYIWYSPTYSFNTKLNTCLAYVGYADQVFSSGDLTADYDASLIIYNYVFDVYSNKTVLYSAISRQVLNGSTTDTVLSNSFDPSPSLSQADFSTQMQELMPN